MMFFCKRRVTAATNVMLHMNGSGSEEGPMAVGERRGGGEGEATARTTHLAAAAAAAAADNAINFQAAGGRVFVMRRKLLSEGGPAPQGQVTAALVHFGWAPGSRAAHDMFDKVVAYGNDSITVEDFELLGDTKATATLTLRPNAMEIPEDWDALVRGFVDSL